MITSVIIKDPRLDAARIRKRTTNSVNSNKVFQRVQNIIDDVARSGDRAIFDYTKKLDGVELKSLLISSNEYETSPIYKVNQRQINQERNNCAKTFF